jgi:ribosome-binding protein aMBF1 (putative translation factor)
MRGNLSRVGRVVERKRGSDARSARWTGLIRGAKDTDRLPPWLPQNYADNDEERSVMAGLADRFATNLKVERLRRKLSQEALAAKAGLSVSYISMLERGQRTPPLDTLESIAKALSVNASTLLQ